MKYAILSDIHGNLPALKLALEDARKNGADGFLFAGDYCTSVPWGNDVIYLLRSMPAARIISGNEEGYLHIRPGDDGQFQVTRWMARQLSPENLAWLDALPAQLSFECEGVGIHMSHSSEPFIGQAELGPFRTCNLSLRYPPGLVAREFFLNDVRTTLAADETFRHRLAELPKGVYIFGHTHSQWHARFGDHLFINPGSCGIVLDRTGFGAPYTLLTVENGQCTVEERRVRYDAEALIEQVKQTEQYGAARVWSEVIFHQWRTCCEHVIHFLLYCEDFAQKTGDPRRPFAVDTWEAAHEAWVKEGRPLHKL